MVIFLLALSPLHRHPSHGIRRLFLGALGQERGQLFGVVRGVDGVAIQCGSEGIAEPVAGSRDRARFHQRAHQRGLGQAQGRGDEVGPAGGAVEEFAA